MLKYSSLNEDQKSKICNGCGAKGWFIKPPQFLFRASCNQHDFYYWRGCNENDRLKADKEFYRYMKIDCEDYVWHKKAYYRVIAYVYFKAVRLFGKKFFYYGNSKRDKKDLRK